MKIILDIELLSLLDRRAITLNLLPRKKKKRLKKELSNLLSQLLYKESYKDLISELQAIESQISSIPGDHSTINH
jgi:hypothetical protein